MKPGFGCLLAGLAMLQAQDRPAIPPGLQRLLQAYPDHLASAEPNAIVWKDGTRMVFDDGRQVSDPELRAERPSLKFQMEGAYPKGDAGVPPAVGADPGRVRYTPFFRKMYGDTPRSVERQLVPVRWFSGRILRVTRVNGVDRHVRAISERLAQLPPELRAFVEAPAGAYAWRPVAGTRRPSAHAFGIALDIGIPASDYWRWTGSRRRSLPAYRNRIPLEIVRIFEEHGFIWGGKWSHFDTMHFEYRPELLAEDP